MPFRTREGRAYRSETPPCPLRLLLRHLAQLHNTTERNRICIDTYIHTMMFEEILGTRQEKRSGRHRTAPHFAYLPTYGGPVVPLCNVSRNQSSVVTNYLRVEEEQHPQSDRSNSTGSAIMSAVGAAPAAEQREHRGMVERRPSVTGTGTVIVTGTRGLIRFEWK